MAERSYLEYESEESDNQPVGSSLVTRCPEGWTGDRVNAFCAALASATRNLGDRTLFAPVDSNGNTVSQQAGTLALQDADNVIFTGGVIDGLRGSVPVGSVIFYVAPFAVFLAQEATLFASGWVLCDGRTVTNPFTGALVGTPSLLGRYPFFGASDSLSQFGSFSQSTSSAGAHAHAEATGVAGAHSHGGFTAATALSTANMPDSVLTDISIGGGGGSQGTGTASITKTRDGTNTPHSHGISSDGNHQHSIASDGTHSHTVLVQPPSIHLIPLYRAF